MIVGQWFGIYRFQEVRTMKRLMKNWMTVVLVLVGANSAQAKYGGGEGTIGGYYA